MELRGYIEVAILVVVMWFVFQDIVQPILISIDPMFADQPVNRIRRGPQTPAQVTGIVTSVVGIFIYYSTRLIYSHGINEYIGGLHVLLFIPISALIPNRYIPGWFVPGDLDLDEW